MVVPGIYNWEKQHLVQHYCKGLRKEILERHFLSDLPAFFSFYIAGKICK